MTFHGGRKHMTIESCKDDGEGKGNAKRNRFRLAKQQLCTCITYFCTFFAVVARQLRDTSYIHVLWRT